MKLWFLVFACSMPLFVSADERSCALTETEQAWIASSEAHVISDAAMDLPFRGAELLHQMAARGDKLCVLVSYQLDAKGNPQNVQILTSNLPERVLIRSVQVALAKFDYVDPLPSGLVLYHWFYNDLQELGYGNVWGNNEAG